MLLHIYDRMGEGATLSFLLHNELGTQGIVVSFVISQVTRRDALGVQGKVGSRVK